MLRHSHHLRLMVDVTVAATCRAEVQKVALDDIIPGIVAKDALKRKLDHDLEPVEAQCKKLQIIAFESAGCPAAASRTDLVRWIKAATPKPDDEDILESEHIRMARSVLQAQTKAVTSLRSRLAHGPIGVGH